VVNGRTPSGWKVQEQGLGRPVPRLARDTELVEVRSPGLLLENHARERHRRAGFRREGLAIVKMLPLMSVQEVN
jgi:hypothetical protein